MFKRLSPAASIILIFVFFLTIVIVTLGAITALILCSQNRSIVTPVTYKLEDQGFSVSAEYQGNNTWDYTAKGFMGSCQTMSSTAEKENNSNEVLIVIKLTTNPSFVACDTNLISGETKGTFTGDEKTELGLKVSNDAISNGPSYTLREGNFTAQVDFNGNSWDYTVKGQVGACDTMSTDVTIRESFPEQVTIYVNVVPPPPNVACIKSIVSKEVTGTFQASEKATIELETRD